MTAAEIRQSFLDFFASKGHTIVRSASLMPTAPNLLFTNAGMNPFVPIFLGDQAPSYARTLGVVADGKERRAADTQKCIRAGGKHNDLEDVGFDTYHHTLFEMLGNWSFGDYFKREAIEWAWELLTEVWKLPKERLYATVYQPGAGDPAAFDEEAHAIWKRLFELAGMDPAVHIRTGGKKDNFWMMGDTGPCGPCSEVHIDLTPNGDSGGELVNADSPWCIELWNLVFIQFAADGQGAFAPLRARHVDTGMGFERVAGLFATTRGFSDFSRPPSNYNSDLFTDLFGVIESLCGQRYGYTMPDPAVSRDALAPEELRDVAFRVLADHIRTLVFSIGDGILPGNEGRNYVLRRILRRAVLFGKRLQLPKGFFVRLADPVIAKFGGVFPELLENETVIRRVIANEEAAFEKTLDRGLELIGRIEGDISGEEAFALYDTYGFPLDLTQLVARERGFTVDTAGFARCMDAQRERARAARKTETIEVREDGDVDHGATEFVGYAVESLESFEAKVVDVVRSGDAAYVVTTATPFYAEMGGQVGDSGTLCSERGQLRIVDTVKDAAGRYLHKLETPPVDLPVGIGVSLTVDRLRRAAIQRHHSATHILNFALRAVLGGHVNQAGSYCGPDRLRFDFNHFEAVSPEQLVEIERIVNQRVLENGTVRTFEIPIAEKPEDIVAVFGEKYGDIVRVVDIGGFSKELCGGTHVATAAEIGLFKIVSESSISAGVRRIEAIAGETAWELVNRIFGCVERLGRQLKCKPDELEQRFESLSEQARVLEKELRQLKQLQAAAQADSLVSKAEERDGVRLLATTVSVDDPNQLKGLANELCNKLGASVVVLGAALGGKASLCAQCSREAVEVGYKAGEIIGRLAPMIDGRGGGKPNFAMGGGTKVDGLESAIAQAFRA